MCKMGVKKNVVMVVVVGVVNKILDFHLAPIVGDIFIIYILNVEKVERREMKRERKWKNRGRSKSSQFIESPPKNLM